MLTGLGSWKQVIICNVFEKNFESCLICGTQEPFPVCLTRNFDTKSLERARSKEKNMLIHSSLRRALLPIEMYNAIDKFVRKPQQ